MKLRLLTLTALVASMFTPLWAQSNAIPGTGTTNDISSVAINGTGAITITPRIGPNALPANNVPVDNTPAGLAFMPGSAGFLGTEISPSDSIPGPGATTVGPTSIALYTISKNTATVVPTGASDAFVGYGTITNTPTPYWTYPTITAGLTPGSFSGLAYAADDFSLGSGTTSTSFYTIRHALSGTDYFTTIVYTSEAVVDLKPMSQGGGPGSTGLSGYFSLTYATSSPGTAGNNMWYLRTAGASDHFLLNGDIGANATAGNTLLGWMAPALASGSNDILDLNASTTKGSFGGTFAAVSGYTAMHFLPASPTVGNYTGDRFYYLRLDASVGNGGTGNTILGFINTTAGSRTISDIANLGAVYSTLTFIPSSAGTTTSGGAAWGSNQLYVAGPTPTTTQQVSFAAIGDQNVGVPFNVSPSASSNGAITLTVDAGSIGTATISPVGGVGPSGSTFIVTPTSPGLVRLRATQPGGAFTANFMQQSFFILGPVTTLAIPSKTLIVATLATPFTPVTATGGTGLVTFSVLPLLPAGLNFNLATGEITGTPGSTLVATNYTVTATDVALASSSKTFSLTIAPALTTTLAVASTTLTVGTPATSFTPVTASGGTGAITFTLTAGTLPTGLSLSTAGAITGTPTVASGATNYTITATDSAVPALTSSKAFSLTVNNAALSTTLAVASTTLTVGTPATSFTPVTASGGTGAITFALTAGTLPTGLSLSTAGAITGTPSVASVATNYTITATDSAVPAITSSKAFSLTVNSAALSTTLAVASTTLTVGTPATSFTPVTSSGGTGAVTFTLTAGTLPTGLSLSTAGAITGTPSVSSVATNYTITATDSAVPAATSSKAFSLTVNSAALSTTLAVASTTLTVGTPATSFTPVTSSGGTGAVTFTLTAGTLPAGLSLSTAGAITGTPSVASVATNYTITATDSAVPAATSSKAFSLTVNNAALSTTLAVASTTLTVGTPATSFTPVTSSGGTGAVTFTLTAGTLPTGLSLSTAGAITGTPTVASVATNYTITATDSSVPAATSSKAFSLTVNNAGLSTTLAVASTTLTVGAPAASFTPVTSSGGTGAVTFTLTAGTLPAGLSLSTAGAITGTPSVTSVATNYTITATDSAVPAATSSKAFSLTVNNAGLSTTLAVASTTLTVGTPAASFTPVTSSGGSGAVTFTLTAGTLPTGLSLSTAGAITGTPSVASVATNYTVTATDSAVPAATSSTAFSLTVNNAALSTTLALASTTLTVGTPATSFTPVTSSGGTGAVTFALTAGTLPAGLSLSTAGAITGTPSVASVATNYTITATDSAVPAATSSKAFSLTVNNAGLSTTLAVASTTLTVGSPATSFTPVTSSGGTGAVTFALTAGTLPTGLSLSTAGAITGTPSVASVATNYTITATDSAVPPATSSKAFSLTVNNAGLSTTLAVASTTLTVGTPATSFTPVTSSGGTGAVTFAVTAGTLPAGLSLSSAGAITGTPSVASVATNYTITATDSAVPPATSSKAFSLTVSATPSIPLSIAAPYAAAGTVGAPFSYTIVATPAPSDYNSSPLPAGLSLNRTTGLLSGTPTVAGTFLVTLEVRNQSGTGAAVLTLTFTPASVAPIITGVLSAPGTVGLSFGPYTIVASGSPTAFSASSLPSGLVLNPVSGVITGTPVAAGVTIVTLTATNAAGSSTAGLTITVTPAGLAPLFISSPRASGAVGVTFVTYVSLATGTPSSFNAVGLPPGLSINPLTGAINGTPTAAGTFTVTLSATNATGTGTGTLTLVIATALTEPSSRIVNFAARAISGPGSESLIMGFVVSGDGKNLLVRGIGPGLTPYGVITALADPFLTLYGPTGVIATNDDWQINQPGQADSLLIAATAARVGAFALPTASKDSSLLLIVNNGAHTTGLVRPNSTTGVALTEIYDTDVALGARLTNVSARMNVTAGEGTLIAGLVIAGNAPKTVLIRGVGPTLSLFGVAGVLANPTITVFAGSNSIATNDDWETGASSAAQITAASVRVGAFALQAGSKDAALLVTLEPGTYTVQVTGVANTTGVALVEIYDTL